MGVTGLWKLIEPCGKPVPVETLEGKILAVDISIWLHQVVKGFQDSQGSALPNAHLLGLFHRLCKLLYYRVRPVFVFDGCVPQLKRDTIARRQQQRSKLNNEADRIQLLLLQSLANEKVVQQALGPNAVLLLKSPSKRPNKLMRIDKEKDELFKLPELPSGSMEAKALVAKKEESSDDEEDSNLSQGFSSDAYNVNLQAIDVRSQHFRSLPAEVRHDILVDIKETRKQSSWGRLHELPSRSEDFSTFQMKRLLKRRAVQESLEEAEREMGGCALTYNELRNLFTEEGIIEPSTMDKNARQICSDENTRFLLVRDLKKKLSETDETTATSCKIEPQQKLVTTSAVQSNASNNNDEIDKDKKVQEKLEEEYDEDLQLAIALSLEDTTQVYNNEDYEYEGNETLRLNPEQRKHLKNAAIGPARAYMIEYGGMNDDEVVGIMEKTQVTGDEDLDIVDRLLATPTTVTKDKIGTWIDKSLEGVKNEDRKKPEQDMVSLRVSDNSETDSDFEVVPDEEVKNEDRKNPELDMVSLRVSDNSETDSDFEVVPDEEVKNEDRKNPELDMVSLRVSDNSETDSDLEVVPNKEVKCNSSPVKRGMEIVLDVKNLLAPEDDIFADIFEAADESQSSNRIADKSRMENEGKNNKPLAVEKKKEGENAGNLKLSLMEDKPILETSDESELRICGKKFKNSIKDSKELAFETNTQTENNDKEISTQNEAVIIPRTDKICSILDELKKQVDEVKTISLDDVKISADSEMNNKPELSPQITLKTEFIEIYDSDDDKKLKLTPQKSPQIKTPSKSKSITEYFQTNYKVVRTPDKKSEEEIPKVKSPFFVNKSPRSGQKRTGGDETGSTSAQKKKCKVSKSLFDENLVVEEAQKQTSTTEEDVINEAARLLKEQKNTAELETLAADLAKERKDLESERNRQDRMGMSISQRMNHDCQQLLRLFGIPYIVAPMEAEAQCAFLDAVELTNGTITDDSDIWLFGGRTVYKNFFEQNKHVLEYRSERIEQTFKCDRKKLIQLACLVGSDYTTGVHGIGAVTALEILASFSSAKETEVSEEGQSVIAAALSTLRRFRDWWESQKTTLSGNVRLNLRKKLKNIELSEGFPNSAVVEAYLKPTVDESKDPFKWGYPDVESIREFTRKTFGWTTAKTDAILTPVMKRVNEKRTQATIRNYFTTKSALSVHEPKVSKRVQKAIATIAGKVPDSEENTKPARRRAKRKSTVTNAKKVEEAEQAELTAEVGNNNIDIASTEMPSTSGAAAAAQKVQRRARIPNTKQTIPQRERDMELMQQNKEKAAAVLKRTTGTRIKKKISN